MVKLPVQVTFRNMQPSEAVEAAIHTLVARLDTFYDGIMGCRVLVDIPHRHHVYGRRYHVRIDLTVPGEEIVVSHEPTLHGAEQAIEQPVETKETELGGADRDLYVALHEAFDEAGRQLQDWVRERRGKVKRHVALPRGRVVKLVPEEGYGFLATFDGREVYFHRHAVLRDGFDRLAVGAEVSFVEEPGEKGPQATTVRLVHPRRAMTARGG